ncbi:MFS transporter [Paenibacillus sp. IB182363]|uniref:MFS transporter n=2 Tax=Paenibacillus oceani TaxID=2772510 RepID=A0A927H3P0_9BACL|nr:MFS transporter [Paenibacillus oceani]
MTVRASQVYILMEFVSSLANTIMFTTYALYYITTLGLNPFELLLVGMALELTVLIFEGITGVVADTYSRRLSVIAGMFALGFGFALQGVIPWLDALGLAVPAIAWLLFSQVVSGVGYTFISGANKAWITDEIGEERVGRLFLRANRLSLVATLIGIPVSVGLSVAGTHLPYLTGGLLYIGLGLFLILRMKETGFVRPEREGPASPLREMTSTWIAGAKAVRGQPILLMMVAVTVFGGAASEGYDRLWEAHLITGIGFPGSPSMPMAVWFGIISALIAFLSLFVVRFAEKRLDVSNKRVVLVGMLVLTGLRIVAIASFALAPNFAWALGSLLAVGIIGTLSGPIYDTWLSLNIESKVRATVLSMLGQADALGQTGGGPLVGWVGHRFTVRASLLVAAALLSPILVVFTRALRKR